MSGWQAFDEEVARWRDGGREVELWWRDDDAADASPALDRLLELQRAADVPLALAVVPARATPALVERLAGIAAIDLLQHGYAHVNHALPPDKKCELGAERPAMLVLGELGTGWMALERLFAGRACRCPAGTGAAVEPDRAGAGAGPAGESASRPLDSSPPAGAGAGQGLRQINTHLDLIDWNERRFVGAEAALGVLVGALRHSRSATGETATEPVGLLSHHLAMDEGAWDFLRSFLAKATTKRGVKIRSARDLFASGEARV
jgi:hypothetical protein